ncbi:MAG: LamG domain-containing protein [Mucilaginibacter sp.]
MKRYKNIFLTGFSALAVVFAMSSCQKKFDAGSYRPSKPLPSYGGYTSSKQIAPDNLVAYWAFNGVLTDSVSKKGGTATGTSFGTGITNKSLQGAANSYALCDAPDGLATVKSLTLSAWVNTPPPSNGILTYFSFANTSNFWGNIECFFENGSDNTNGKLRIHLAQNGSDNTYSIDNVANLFNTWVNIVVTYNQTDGTCVLYVNGDAKNTGKAGNLTGPLAFTNIGKVTFGTTQFMTDPSQTSATGKQDWAGYITGQIDQVRVYNSALSATQVSALYNLDKAGR